MLRKAAEILKVDASRGSLEGRGRLLDEKALLLWLVKKHTGVSKAWVSERLWTGHPTAVSKAVRRVEESRRLLRKGRGLAKRLIA